MSMFVCMSFVEEQTDALTIVWWRLNASMQLKGATKPFDAASERNLN